MLISLHGPDAATHESFTSTPGSFRDATTAIRLAAQAGLPVAVSTVLIQSNQHRLGETLDVALALGAERIIFGRYIGTPRPGLTLEQDGLRAAVQAVQSLIDAGRPATFGNCVPQCFEPSASSGCTAGQSFCTVDPWGNMRPCTHTPLVAGNLLTQPLQAVWWSKPMARWRAQVTADCRNCSAYAQCGGGCRALALQHGRDPLQGSALNASNIPAALTLPLYAHAVPCATFQVRTETDGPVLVQAGRVLPVSSAMLSFLQEVGGRLTLGEIQANYGPQALSFVGGLYVQRFIELGHQ
jgi:radical SAM protein with 4Fe4S-binding SPASM domain